MSGRTILIVYAVGALIALWRSDAKVGERVVLAVLWPIGPIAFVVTTSILVAASPLAFLPRRS
jgi:hypothetical protein